MTDEKSVGTTDENDVEEEGYSAWLNGRFLGSVPVMCCSCHAENAPGPYFLFHLAEGFSLPKDVFWNVAVVCSICMTHNVTHRIGLWGDAA